MGSVATHAPPAGGVDSIGGDRERESQPGSGASLPGGEMGGVSASVNAGAEVTELRELVRVLAGALRSQAPLSAEDEERLNRVLEQA